VGRLQGLRRLPGLRLERLRRLRRLRRRLLLLLGTLSRLLNGTVRILLPMQIVLAGSFSTRPVLYYLRRQRANER
jgi:hypothetical protein